MCSKAESRTPEVSETPRRERGLAWFYASLAVAAGLFAFVTLAWKPLQAAYWERRVRLAYEHGDAKSAADALDELDAMGPGAQTAVGRLLAPNGAWYRGQVAQLLGRKENRWLLPALVRLAREDRDPAVAHLAVSAAESMSGQIFLPVSSQAGGADLDGARVRLVEWWEREGRIKYGG